MNHPTHTDDGELMLCTMCKENKPVTDFWKQRSRTRGYSTYCKDCYRKYYRNRYNKIKAKINRNRYKFKEKARELMHSAIRAGTVTKEPCYLCGELIVDAHHLNYDYPLKVIWLCKKHHSEIHDEIK